jgi:hypothetical protein
MSPLRNPDGTWPAEALPRKLVSTAERCACGNVIDGKGTDHCTACHRKKYDEFNAGAGGHPGYMKLLLERRALHVEKSSGYGTDSDPFANFTTVSQASGEPRYLYPILRSIEKLTRCLSLHTQGRADELGEEFTDVASLMDCAEAMRREDGECADGR